MSRNPQLKHLIDQAAQRVSERGTDAELQDIMLACFGYLAEELRPRRYNIRFLLALGAAVGAFVVGLMRTLEFWN